MTKSALLASTAIALVLCAAQATAQMQQKAPDEKQAPQMRSEPKGDNAVPDKQAIPEKVEKKKDRAVQDKTPEQGQQQRPKAVEKKQGTPDTQKSAEPKDVPDKGKAEKQQRSEKGESQKKSDKAEAPKKDLQTKDKAATGERKDAPGQGTRTQLSEQQRTNVHQTIVKERNVNRVTSVNFTINVGTRVPRSVRLVVLPATVIAIVPHYRNYRYVVVHDDICIIDPATYEIVEVIKVSDGVAYTDGGMRLTLTEDEKRIVLREIDTRSGGSTLGLGVFTEGADVPREVNVMAFPVTVVERVPKLRDYRYFTAENSVAIVDPAGRKVLLVIEDRR